MARAWSLIRCSELWDRARCLPIRPEPSSSSLREMPRHLLHIREELTLRVRARGGIRSSQYRGRVDRRDHGTSVRCFHRAASFLRHPEALPHDRLRRCRAETDDDLGCDEPNLLLQPWMTRPNLGVVRFLVNAALCLLAALPLEVLHRVRDVHVVAIDARLLERAVQQLSGRTDKRMTRPILLIPRLLADYHDTRLLGSFAEYCLRAQSPEVTPTTRHRGVAQLRQRGIRGN